ncbi:AGL101Cp [Eremothecium gossypii ATCC 10895]|uniref:DNA topoisomerase n=1 Tax=Eremothecium gossypii (strain ATCC 10895 / CBS 109.51 / FGSC 9923 / NRRL Y-1056) TaxID=284811 RepID=Q751B3_EREGS|nr:AGL101Cp [Eremothecium gossypii ATCC 10895]AAS54390.1 AGL101Cp [Eremothecium gossypii ATCC 10895]AEY98717.1 FAGL101Cp [Eremothecium gossypii FDAG1]
MRVVCVAEKNSIAKAVAGILGGGNTRTRSSPSKYIKNYDFTYNFAWAQGGERCEVTMTAVAGHLMSQDFGPQYGWNKCDPRELFGAEILETPTREIAENITRECRGAEYLMIWTDCDREGEAIGWEIARVAMQANTRLVRSRIHRAVFSHLGREHIMRAANSPSQIDMNAVDAVKARSEIDLRAGYAFTRLLTATLRAKVEQDMPAANEKKRALISYGTCQFPTLGFVVDRYERIQNFVSEGFWYLQLLIEDPQCARKVTFSWDRGHLFDRLCVLCLYETCIEATGNKALVSSVTAKDTSKYRPLPLTTVELQKNCSKFLRMSAKQSLDAAEKLYQKGFISYPRTETDVFSKQANLQGLVQQQTEHSQWGAYASKLLSGEGSNRFQWPREGKHDDQAHPPIHPVLCAQPDANLSVDEKRVYEYVVRHFLACCSQDAKGRSSKIKLKWHTEEFSATGLQVHEENFLEIYTYQKWTSSEQLPTLPLNSQVEFAKAEMKSGKTSPPKYITESELIMLMDANGIGTDATIAEHIEKIQERQYIKAEGTAKNKVFKPTMLGRSLVHGFEDIGLEESFAKPFLRRDMELDLKRICEGTKDRNSVLANLIGMYMDYYDQTDRQRSKLIHCYERIKQES